MSSIDRNSHYEASFVATGTVKPRSLFQKHGKVYQVCGEDAMEEGELVVGHNNRRSEITKATITDAFAEDDDVFYDPATNTATAALVPGGYKAGIASKGSSATETTVMVLLNF